MKISEIANQLNDLSKNYQIGKLQQIRKELKQLKRRAGSNIFDKTTISDDGEWAFHFGGRRELQFNIGFENEGFRFGLAFSLETSRSLPDIKILFPRIYKLNSIIRESPEFFSDYKMWFWDKNRSEIGKVTEITKSNIKQGIFIFIGKIIPLENIDFNNILSTFDNLLELYRKVEERKTEVKIINDDYADNFSFKKENRKLV